MIKPIAFVLLSILLGLATPMPLAERSLGSCYKKATLTQYWIPKEGEKDMLNDGKIVSLTGTKNRSLKTVSGKTIAKVSKTTYEVSSIVRNLNKSNSFFFSRNSKWRVLVSSKMESWSTWIPTKTHF
jgi:hypothetical protein